MGLTYVEGGGGRSARLHLTLSLVKKKKSNFLVMNKIGTCLTPTFNKILLKVIVHLILLIPLIPIEQCLCILT